MYFIWLLHVHLLSIVDLGSSFLFESYWLLVDGIDSSLFAYSISSEGLESWCFFGYYVDSCVLTLGEEVVESWCFFGDGVDS